LCISTGTRTSTVCGDDVCKERGIDRLAQKNTTLRVCAATFAGGGGNSPFLLRSNHGAKALRLLVNGGAQCNGTDIAAVSANGERLNDESSLPSPTIRLFAPRPPRPRAGIGCMIARLMQ
jgi:hypothetical protein